MENYGIIGHGQGTLAIEEGHLINWHTDSPVTPKTPYNNRTTHPTS